MASVSTTTKNGETVTVGDGVVTVVKDGKSASYDSASGKLTITSGTLTASVTLPTTNTLEAK